MPDYVSSSPGGNFHFPRMFHGSWWKLWLLPASYDFPALWSESKLPSKRSSSLSSTSQSSLAGGRRNGDVVVIVAAAAEPFVRLVGFLKVASTQGCKENRRLRINCSRNTEYNCQTEIAGKCEPLFSCMNLLVRHFRLGNTPNRSIEKSKRNPNAKCTHYWRADQR